MSSQEIVTMGTESREHRGTQHGQGISNRESPQEETREREEHPPVHESAPQAEDASGRQGPEDPNAARDGHTSHKAGSRSVAQKEANTRYPDRSMPAARKVAGAFGREPSPERQPDE
jgi:hypothetical protein